jgi:hypothetical protein
MLHAAEPMIRVDQNRRRHPGAKSKAEGDELTATHCQLIANFTGLGVRPMPTKSPQAANQVHDQHDEQDRPNDPKAAAHPPPGITVIPSASTEQQNQKDN